MRRGRAWSVARFTRSGALLPASGGAAFRAGVDRSAVSAGDCRRLASSLPPPCRRRLGAAPAALALRLPRRTRPPPALHARRPTLAASGACPVDHADRQQLWRQSPGPRRDGPRGDPRRSAAAFAALRAPARLRSRLGVSCAVIGVASAAGATSKSLPRRRRSIRLPSCASRRMRGKLRSLRLSLSRPSSSRTRDAYVAGQRRVIGPGGQRCHSAPHEVERLFARQPLAGEPFGGHRVARRQEPRSGRRAAARSGSGDPAAASALRGSRSARSRSRPRPPRRPRRAATFAVARPFARLSVGTRGGLAAAARRRRVGSGDSPTSIWPFSSLVTAEQAPLRRFLRRSARTSTCRDSSRRTTRRSPASPA